LAIRYLNIPPSLERSGPIYLIIQEYRKLK
jgi:hypothetical protein